MRNAVKSRIKNQESRQVHLRLKAMIDSQQILQTIASSRSKSSINSQEIAQKLGAKLLDVEMLLHRMQDDGDVELELIRSRIGFVFAAKMTKQGRAKLKR